MNLAFDVCGTGLNGNAHSLPLSNLPLHGTGNVTDYNSPQHRQPTLFATKNQYATYESRLASYNSKQWPAASSLVRPQLLAAAGFYYFGDFQGYQDGVKCFFCDVGVCKWEPDDDPWSEHLRCSPNCLFVHDLNNFNKYKTIKDQFVGTETSNPSSTTAQSSVEHIPLSRSASVSSGCSSTTSSTSVSSSSSQSTTSHHTSRLTCKSCLKEEVSVTFFPCAHLAACVDCAVKSKTCPACNNTYNAAIQIYIS